MEIRIHAVMYLDGNQSPALGGSVAKQITAGVIPVVGGEGGGIVVE